jgi:DNA-directed RNA polymerase specialized sigma24 family protein
MDERSNRNPPPAQGPSDTELLRRMAEGDTLAFAEFYDRHATLLRSIAVKVLGDVHEAEEVLQEAACLIWRTRRSTIRRLANPPAGRR